MIDQSLSKRPPRRHWLSAGCGLLATLAALALPALAQQQMAIWTFGPNASGYTEAPAFHALNSPPSLTIAGGTKDTNGKDGTPYTDLRSVFHATGQGAAWNDLNISSPGIDAYWIIGVNTTGWQNLAIRFDYKKSNINTNSIDLEYRINGGAWVGVLNNQSLPGGSGVFSPFSVNLAAHTAINNQALVEFRFSDLNENGNDEFVFDNLEVSGTSGGPSITLTQPQFAATGPNISGVVGDATDQLSTIGVDFTLAHPTLPPGSLTFSAASSNQSVVPNANLVITGADSLRNLRITPVGRGYATITVSSSDGSQTTNLPLNYAAALNGPVPANYTYGAGMSDASTAIALADDYMLVTNDEGGIGNGGPLNSPGPQIYLFDRVMSGLPLRAFDFTAQLGLPDTREVDLEGSTRIGNRIFWIASHGNNQDGEIRLNRRRLFATDLSGSGEDTDLAYVGRYDNLREDLLTWDSSNWHGRGADHYGFVTGAYAVPNGQSGGNPPKTINGFSIEGLAIGPDGATAYIGFRAPLVPAAGTAGKALIVGIKNFQTWFASGLPLAAADFAAPIELDLGGRTIRSIEENGRGEYLIIAGSWGDAETTGINFALYRWTGNPADTKPVKLRDLLTPVPGPTFAGEAIQPGGYEGIVAAPSPLTGGTVPLVLDNGRSKWYNAANLESKELPGGHQRFATESVALPAPSTLIGSASGGSESGIAVARSGNLYVINHQDYPSNANTLVALNRDLSVRWSVALETASFDEASPVIGPGEVIYAGVRNFLHAYDKNGALLWKFNVGADDIRSDPVIGADGTIYVGVDYGDARIYAINPNGTQKWMALTQGDCIRSLAIGPAGEVYTVNCEDGMVWAFHPDTGALLWNEDPPGGDEMYELAVAANGNLYVGDDSGLLHAFDGAGNWLWSFASVDGIEGVPALGQDGTIYAADTSGRVYALTSAGAQIWSVDVGDAIYGGVTLGADGTLYVMSGSTLRALDPANGAQKWSRLLDIAYSRPVVATDGSIYVHGRYATYGVLGDGGWTENALAQALAAYAPSSWPTTGQNPFGTGELKAPAATPPAELVAQKILPAGTWIEKNMWWDYAVGYHFTPKLDGRITALGGLFSGTKTVKLFNQTTGEILAQKQVTGNNQWTYADIEPVTLLAGQNYTIAVYCAGEGGAYFYGPYQPAGTDFVTVLGATYAYTGDDADARPVNSDPYGYYYGIADFRFQPLDQAAWAPVANPVAGSNIGWHYSMGYHFTPQKAGWVTALGGNFNGAKVVKLFNRTTGQLLATATVTSANSFAYTAIVPVPVQAGVNYTVAAYMAGSGASYCQSQSALFPRTSGDLVIEGTTYAYTGTDPNARPTNLLTTIMYGQADVKFVPKP